MTTTTVGRPPKAPQDPRSAPIRGGHPAQLLRTNRTDRWWVGPLLTIGGLLGFIVYSTWAAFQGAHYWVGGEPSVWGYLSPFYSPPLFVQPGVPGAAPLEHAWFGTWPSWWPGFLPASPALLILVFPGIFRFTCYYYRKAYYRSFTGTPPGCGVCPVKQQDYKGERGWLRFQNLHRFTLYIALVFLALLTFDAILSFARKVDGEVRFGMGVGSLVLVINVILLGGYTFGCHSFRYMFAGRSKTFTRRGKPLLRWWIFKRCTWLNQRHMAFAWMSLFWVGFSDFYIRMVSMGVFYDLNTWK